MQYDPNLDSLRAFAAMLVIGYHFHGALPFGWVGVSFFFVLSGFLISSIVATARDRDTPFTSFAPQFFSHRCRRLLPLYLGYLAAVGSGFYLLGLPGGFERAAMPLFTYASNFYGLYPDYPASPFWSHLWSLAAEWQLYLVWPLLL